MDSFNSWTPDKLAFFNNDDYAPTYSAYEDTVSAVIAATEESDTNQIESIENIPEREVAHG